jgi:hypothetical protein
VSGGERLVVSVRDRGNICGNIQIVQSVHRVEVRVLFGASSEAPHVGAFVVLGSPRPRMASISRQRPLAMENQEVSRDVLDDLEGRMSVHHEKHRDNYVVRRREEGTNRSRRFADEAEAEAFDAGVPGVRLSDRRPRARDFGAGLSVRPIHGSDDAIVSGGCCSGHGDLPWESVPNQGATPWH